MKAFILSLAICISLLAKSEAVDLVTPAGTYYDIKVTRVQGEALRITHREGIALVDFDDLPPAMQQQYGWTPEKSAARKAAREAEAKRIAEEERMAEEAAKPKPKAAAVKAEPAMESKRVADDPQLKLETEEALKESLAEAARMRAELDRERRGGSNATPADSPSPREPNAAAPAKPEKRADRGTTVPAPAAGTVSSLLGEKKMTAGNRNLLIAAGVSAAIVLLLFLIPSGKKKPQRR